MPTAYGVKPDGTKDSAVTVTVYGDATSGYYFKDKAKIPLYVGTETTPRWVKKFTETVASQVVQTDEFRFVTTVQKNFLDTLVANGVPNLTYDATYKTLKLDSFALATQSYVQGLDSELWTVVDGHVNAIADINQNYAKKESPALTGTPTAPTAAKTTNDTQIATTAFVKTALSDLINGAGPALDTLQELATALGNDPNFATTIANSLAGKSDKGHKHTVSEITDIATTLAAYGKLSASNAWTGVNMFKTTLQLTPEGADLPILQFVKNGTATLYFNGGGAADIEIPKASGTIALEHDVPKVTIGAVAPTSPKAGDVWFDIS